MTYEEQIEKAKSLIGCRRAKFQGVSGQTFTLGIIEFDNVREFMSMFDCNDYHEAYDAFNVLQNAEAVIDYPSSELKGHMSLLSREACTLDSLQGRTKVDIKMVGHLGSYLEKNAKEVFVHGK